MGNVRSRPQEEVAVTPFMWNVATGVSVAVLCAVFNQRDLRVNLKHELKQRHTTAETYRNTVRRWGVDSTSERTVCY